MDKSDLIGYARMSEIMAQGESAGFAYWINELVKSDGLDLRSEVPKEKRQLYRRITRFLIKNEFENKDELRNGELKHIVK